MHPFDQSKLCRVTILKVLDTTVPTPLENVLVVIFHKVPLKDFLCLHILKNRQNTYFPAQVKY